MGSAEFFTSNNELISLELKELLAITDIVHHNTLNSIAAAVNNTSKGWLRKGERWEEQGNKFMAIKDKILSLAKKLGYIDKIRPIKTMYNRALLLGSDADNVRERINTMLEAKLDNIHWSKCVMLGSDRSLELSSEAPLWDQLLLADVIAKNYPATETGMINYLFYKEYFDKLPTGFENVSPLFINTIKPDGKKRADTEDTIINWLQIDNIADERGELLVFSNQPFIAYQDKVIKYIFAKHELNNFNILTVGEAAQPFIHPNIILDSIARDLFFLQKLKAYTIN